MTDQWQELKETITEMRDNDGTGTQQEVCKFLVNYMDILEKQMQEPCEDAIRRQAAIRIAEQGQVQGYEWQFKELVKLPPVTVEQKTAYWVEENIDKGSRKIFCSECGCPPPFEHVSDGDVYSANGYGVVNKTKFCPNCGAKMVEPQESEG